MFGPNSFIDDEKRKDIQKERALDPFSIEKRHSLRQSFVEKEYFFFFHTFKI